MKHVAIAAAVLALMIVPASPASWSYVSSPNRQVPSGSFSGVSCTSARACVAVGSGTDGLGNAKPLAERWNGGTWSVASTTFRGTNSHLLAVSCASSSACVAVGDWYPFGLSYPDEIAPLTEIFNGTSWSLQVPPRQSGSLTGVSCLSPSACIAVGGSNSQGPDVQTTPTSDSWNGTSWIVHAAAIPRSNDAVLFGVSCTSETSCEAVGSYATLSGVRRPLAESWNGTIWSIQSTPHPIGKATTLSGVSCSAVSTCLAVGSYTNSSGSDVTLAERWNGTKWSIIFTPNATGDTGSQLSGISCTSTSTCVAVGGYTNSSGTGGTLAERWDGTSWSRQYPPNRAAGTNLLSGVSCMSQAACLAVGSYNGGSLSLTETWNGSSWEILATSNPAGGTNNSLAGISCTSSGTSSGFCEAIGSYERYGSSEPLAEGWAGANWSVQPTPDPLGTDAVFSGVSCSSSSACEAVGSYTSTAGGTVTLAEIWNGTSWSIQPTPDPVGAASLFSGVSCTLLSACEAVGSSTSTAGGTVTLAEDWNGTTWSLQPTPNPAGETDALFSGVSCSGLGACEAVGSAASTSDVTAALAEYWNGTSWSIQPTQNPLSHLGVMPSVVLSGVSCASSIACVAVGSLRTARQNVRPFAELWYGAKWSMRLPPVPTRCDHTFSNRCGRSDLLFPSVLVGVFCTTSSACEAVGTYAKFLYPPSSYGQDDFVDSWNGRTWSFALPRIYVGYRVRSLNGVSCLPLGHCFAVGSYYREQADASQTLIERQSVATAAYPPGT